MQGRRRVMRIAGALPGLLLAVTARAAPLPDLKSVPLDVFMHGQVKVPIDLPIQVPVDYEWAPLAKAPRLHAYWMRPQDVEGVNQSGNLPSAAGYLYGNLSLNVAYDPGQRIFVGAEDPESLQQLRSRFPSVRTEHLDYGPHAVLLLSAEAADSGKAIYAMYVSIEGATTVVYVALRPPGNSKEIGDRIWDELRRAILAAGKGKSPARP